MLVAALLVAAQPDLDAPVEAHPIVRTEIHRGYLAAQACMDVSRGAHLMEFFGCISDADKANQAKMGTSNEPFAAGLYCGAKLYGKIIADSAPKYKALYVPVDVPLLQSHAAFYEQQYARYRDALKLNDQDLEAAAMVGS